jgi:hypothetical protein
VSEHAVLAPSDAGRWARCVGALHMSKGMKGIDSEDAASGTCSHWILETCLKENQAPELFLGKKLNFSGFEFEVDQDRCDRVSAVMRAIYREPGQMWIEQRLNTSPALDVPGQFGRADIIKLDALGSVVIEGEHYTGVLSVHDFKDGYNRVYAENNMQGLVYLAAAYLTFDIVTPINALRFCIHQPKVGHYDEFSYTRKQIEEFIVGIRPVAKLAYSLWEGSTPFDASKHLLAGDEQCYWCPVRGSCPARAKAMVDLFAAVITDHAIDDSTLAKLYARLDEVEQACKDYRGEALKRAMSGRKIEGFKLVKGKRGNRAWADKDKAEDLLLKNMNNVLVYEPQEIISPTEAENLMGKSAFKKTFYPTGGDPLVKQSDGAYTLAPENDPRDEIVPETFKPVVEHNLL